MKRVYVLLGALAVVVACGKADEALVPSRVDTTAFDGEYAIKLEASFARMRQVSSDEADPARRRQGEVLLQMMADQYANFRIKHGVIRSGIRLVQEFSLTEATAAGDTLRGKAVWHEDVGDPGDSSEVLVRLTLKGESLEFSMLNEQGEPEDVVVFTRKRPGA